LVLRFLDATGLIRVSNYAQLTHDGLQKTLIGTDGSRLFLTVEFDGGRRCGGAGDVGDPTKIEMPGSAWCPWMFRRMARLYDR
jgi:hypothetical protein